MAQLMTQADYARHRKERGLPGGTGAAVSKAIKAGRLNEASGALVRQDGKLLIDPVKADRDWAGNTAIDRGATPGPVKVREERDDGQARELVTLNDVRAKQVGVATKKTQAEYDLLMGKLVKRRHVELAVAGATTAIRDYLRGLPAKLGPQLAQAATPEEAARLLAREMDYALNELGRRLEQDMLVACGADRSEHGPAATAAA